MNPKETSQTEHPPGRSSTPAAWGALAVMAILLGVWIFFEPLACGVLHAGLTSASWLRGDQLSVGKLTYAGNGIFRADEVEFLFGTIGHRSSWKSERMEFHPIHLMGVLFRGKNQSLRLIRELKVSKSKLLVDCRGASDNAHGVARLPWIETVVNPANFFPSAIEGGPIDFVVIGDAYRCSLSGLRISLPDRWAGKVAFDEAQLDMGPWHGTFSHGASLAGWDGNSLHLENLILSKETALRDVTLTLKDGRADFGIRGAIGKALIRGDGSVGSPSHPHALELTLVGENLQLGALAELLGQDRRASGTVGQARFTFRGDPDNPMEADSSLRLVANNFRWDGRGWDSLRLAATLTGRKLTVSELSLQQEDNVLTGKGLVNLPRDWHEALKSPFTAFFSATLDDAGALASLAGPQFATLSGGLEMEGEIQGADNKATGHANLQGVGMKIHGLPVDWMKGEIQFKGDHVELTHLEAWSGQDNISMEGSVQNNQPHAYKASAQINVHNLTKRLGQVGIKTATTLGAGAVKCSWQGEGTKDAHSGSFQARVTEWVSKWTATGMSGSFEGMYSPDSLRLTKAEFLQGELKLALKLNATAKSLEAAEIKATRGEKEAPLVQGSIMLPIDAMDVWESGDVVRTLDTSGSFAINLALRGIKAEEIEELLGQQVRLTGSLEGDLSASGTMENPEIHGELKIGSFVSLPGEAPADLNLTLNAVRGEFKGSLCEAIGQKPLMQMELDAPMHVVRNQGRLQFAQEAGPVRGSAKLQQVPLEGWASLLGLTDWPFKGAILDGSCTLGGSVEKPTFDGALMMNADEARLMGMQYLRKLRLPLALKSNQALLAGGVADYNGKPLNLTGELNWSKEHQGGNLLMKGEALPIPLGGDLLGEGDTDLTVSLKPIDRPELTGTILLKTITGTIPLRLTPSFVPPGIRVVGEKIPMISYPPGSAGNGQLSVNIKVMTPGFIALGTPAGDQHHPEGRESPRIAVDLTVTGGADATQLGGTVQLQNGTMELPCGPFQVPQASLMMDGGGSWFHALAYGMTQRGECMLSISSTANEVNVESTGPTGITASDRILALAIPTAAGGKAPLFNQSYAWIRQGMIFPDQTMLRNNTLAESTEPASLGFYGSPWVWGMLWSKARTDNQ